jgi:hypothetical protein
VQFATFITPHKQDNNNAAVIKSNTSLASNSISHHTLGMLAKPLLAVANTGATSLFLTKGAPCQNKPHALNPVIVFLPDGRKIESMHLCDVMIPSLPIVLTGHIMPDMTTASLFGVRVLCKAGCQVLFDDDKCQVIFNGTVILTGYKDIASNLWMLPIHPSGMPQTALDAPDQSPLGPCMSDAPRHTANFSYHCTKKENNVNSCTKVYATPPSHPCLPQSNEDFCAVLPISPRRPSPNISHQAQLQPKAT